MAELSIQEVLRYAVNLEKRGLLFFRKWAHKAESDEVKMFFSMLADEEEEHVDVFLKLADKVGEGDGNYKVSERFMSFYESFSRDVMFNDEVFSKADNLNQAFELAKKQERDVQMFYSELKKYVDKSQYEVIDRIISEEQDHYKMIGDLQKKLKIQKSILKLPSPEIPSF